MFDVFGYTEERRTERALVQQYQDSITEIMATFAPGKHALALEIAAFPKNQRLWPCQRTAFESGTRAMGRIDASLARGLNP